MLWLGCYSKFNKVNTNSVKIIYRELEFMGLWELAAGCGGVAGSGRTGRWFQSLIVWGEKE